MKSLLAASASFVLALTSLAQETQLPPPANGPSYRFADFDRDGFADVFVVDPLLGDRLFKNLGDGTFADVTGAVGLAATLGSRAAAWQDFDRDGWLDLYVSATRGGRLLRNARGVSFVDVTAEVGLEATGAVELSAVWLDYDLDGWSDLHLFTERGDRLLRNAGGVFERSRLPSASALDTAVIALELPSLRSNAANALVAPPGAPSGGTPTTTSGVAAASATCLDTLLDVATSNCLTASSAPVLGALYPLSSNFNLDGAGNVGLGTTAPAHKLDVAGSVRASGALISTTSASAPLTVSSNIKVDNLNADRLDGLDASAFTQLGNSIETGEITNGTLVDADVNASADIAGTKVAPDFGAQDVSTTGTANIGNGAASGDQLTVHGRSRFQETLRVDLPDGPGPFGTGGIEIRLPHDPAEPYLQLGHGTSTWQMRLLNNDLRFSDDFASPDDLRVSGSGRVGVSTNSPEAALHVHEGSAGTVTALANSSAVFESDGDNYLNLLAPDANKSGIYFGGPTAAQGGGVVFDDSQTPSGLQLRIGTATPALVVTSARDVGIGVLTPEGRLHVGVGTAGTVTANPSSILVAENNQACYLSLLGSSSNEKGVLFGDSNSNAHGSIRYDVNTTTNGLTFRTNGDVTRMVLDSSGNLGLGTATPTFQLQLSLNSAAKPSSNTWTISSDRRLKKNIAPLSGALERLMKLRGVTFDWIDPASQGGCDWRQIGLIAQEVEDVFPRWIGTDAKGFKTLTVAGFEALTTEALRELRAEKDAQIGALGQRIAAQDALIARLMERIDELDALVRAR